MMSKNLTAPDLQLSLEESAVLLLQNLTNLCYVLKRSVNVKNSTIQNRSQQAKQTKKSSKF